jgi:Right handed beta helix region
MNRLLLAILVLMTPILGEGATYYVAKTGSDSNACTGAQSASTPKLTIKAGLACLKGGDTLIIKAGTYKEGIPIKTIPSGTSNSSHTIIRAATGETVVINGVANNAGVMLIYSRSFITFDGIIFDGSSVPGHVVYIGRGSTSDPASTYIKMQNCTVRNSRYNSGILAGHNQKDGVSCKLSFIKTSAYGNGNDSQDHGIYIVCRDVTVDGGSYYDNSGHGVHVFAQSQSGATNNALIKGVRAYGNGSYGIGLYSGSNLMAYNNLIYGNAISTSSGGIAVRYGATGAKVYNNTVYNNRGVGIRVTENPATIKNNIIYQNSSTPISDTASPPSAVSNNLTTNPSFVNAAASNFSLSGSSPAINKGLVVSVVTHDFVGTLRPQGTTHDIGAYEYKGSTLSSPTSLTIVGD